MRLVQNTEGEEAVLRFLPSLSAPSARRNQTLNRWWTVRSTARALLQSNFEVRHPRCVGSITKNFLCVTHTVEHNYISSSSTVGIQLHVSALYVGHLQVVM